MMFVSKKVVYRAYLFAKLKLINGDFINEILTS